MFNLDKCLFSIIICFCRSAIHVCLKINKLLLTCVGHATVQVVADACQSDSSAPPISPSIHNHAVVLQQALHYIPNPSAECMTRNVAIRLGQNLGEQATGVVPDLATMKAVQKIAWSASSGSLQMINSTNEEIHQAFDKSVSIESNKTEIHQAFDQSVSMHG